MRQNSRRRVMCDLIQPANIGTGLKMLAGAADHQAADAAVARQPLQAADQPIQHCGIVHALPTSGRFSVTVATPRSSTSSRTTSSLITLRPFPGLCCRRRPPRRSGRLRRHKLPGEQRRQCGRPARLGNQAQLLPQHALRGSDGCVGHQHRPLHERLRNRKHQRTHLARPGASRQRGRTPRSPPDARHATRWPRSDNSPARLR